MPQIEDWAAASNLDQFMTAAAANANMPLNSFVDPNNPPPNIQEWGSGGSAW